MAFEKFQLGDDDAANRMLITVVSEILLVCATVLLLFVYLSLPVDVSTMAAIVFLFAGSLFCWRSYPVAQIILILSLLVCEFVLLKYFDYLLIPFIVLDILVLPAVAKAIQLRED